MVLESDILQRTFKPEGTLETREWRNLRNYQFRIVYSSLSVMWGK